MKKIKRFGNKRIYAICAAFVLASLGAFAERAPEYISPNNDGVKDTLEIPLKVKEKRFIKEWKLTIYNEERKPVRTIGNKRKDDEHLSVKGFFKKLVAPKTGIDVPSSVVWNGLLGEEAAALGLVPGEVAPDGIYYYTFSATDDNDNTGTSREYAVIVDCTPPTISFGKMTDDEKSFGEGEKTSLRIQQNGSEETLWTGAIIYNADGKKVRTYRWENSRPAPEVIWDGTSDTGAVVPDGVYTYEIYATDRAGNTSEHALVNNIIFSATKPVINISLRGMRFFSPNGDGIFDTADFDVHLPVQASKVNSLDSWKISILTSDGKTVYEKSGGEEGLSEFSFDGNDAGGKILPEGEYKASLSARYINGYVPPVCESPLFILDMSAPSASVSVKNGICNGESNIEISQKQTSAEPAFNEVKVWNGVIKDEGGNVVRTYSFGSRLTDTVLWNGSESDGHFAGDGKYYYELSVSDSAGNTSVVRSSDFVVDTSKTELVLSLSDEIFSPNGDGAKDFVSIYPAAKTTGGIESYTLEISNDSGLVRTFRGSESVPETIAWDGLDDSGKKCADGAYEISFSSVAKNGTKVSPVKRSVVLDTLPPEINAETPYKLFSPDGLDSNHSTRQVLPVHVTKCSEEEIWNCEIKNSSEKIVWKNSWQDAGGKKSKASDFEWNALDTNGNKVSDGVYSLEIFALDEAGNRGSTKISGIRVDSREARAFITLSESGISPNGDGVVDSQTISVRTTLGEGLSDWTFSISDSDGKAVKSWSGNGGEVPSRFVWDGKDDDGNPMEGNFFAKLVANYEKGNVIDELSSPFVCTAVPPVLNVISSANPEEGQYFSPDNDGLEDELDMLLFVRTKSKVRSWQLVVKDSREHEETFWRTSGKIMPADETQADTYRATVVWDGRGNNGEIVMSAEDYPYVLTVTDELGMTSVYEGIIPVDVLVLFDGGRLKMQVPSIVFRGDAADFLLAGERDSSGKVLERSSLTPEQKANNIRVLNRVSQILNKFGNYKVTVVGHANPMNQFSGPEEDNPEENRDGPWGRGLKPLSLERAQFVVKWLSGEGKISSSRLKAEGKGGLETIVDKNDLKNRWKNRRVEFILEK